jgi:hypothetical protein
MITATYIELDGHTALQLNFPKGPEVVKVHGGIGEAERLVYYHNRRYILDKINSWLNQRKIAVKQSPDKSRLLKVATMQVLISSYRDKSLYQLCKMIKQHDDYFKAISPEPGSSHYPYYKNTILPILGYCLEVQ